MKFVGRQTELEQLLAAILDPQIQLVLIVGQAGMGKSSLLRKFSTAASLTHPDWSFVTYEAVSTDSPDSIMAQILDDAYDASGVGEGSLAPTPQRLKQWKALLDTINLGDLVFSLRRDPSGNTRTQLHDRLQKVSKALPEGGRFVIMLDPNKHLGYGSEEAWWPLAQQLPNNIKLVFAQRSDDRMITNEEIVSSPKVRIIPSKNGLTALSDAEAYELVDRSLTDMSLRPTVRASVASLAGHPYAIAGFVDLVNKNASALVRDNPAVAIARAQWKSVCSVGTNAMRLFKALATLNANSEPEIIADVSGLETDEVMHLLANDTLRALLVNDIGRYSIYHAILSDHIAAQVTVKEGNNLHTKALRAYLSDEGSSRDAVRMRATRAPEHALAALGPEEFVDCVTQFSRDLLIAAGLYDDLDSLLRRAQAFSLPNASKAKIFSSYGILFLRRFQYQEAEEALRQAIAVGGETSAVSIDGWNGLGLVLIETGRPKDAIPCFEKVEELSIKHDVPGALGNAYGNLGLAYEAIDDIEVAEKMYEKSIEVERSQGRLHGVCHDLYKLANMLRGRGELEKAKRLYDEALMLAEQIGEFHKRAVILSNMAVNFAEEGKYDEAFRILDQAEHASREVKDDQNLAFVFNTRGLLQGNLGKSSEAAASFDLAWDLFEQIGDREGMATVMSNRAENERNYGNPLKAREMHLEAKAIFESIGRVELARHAQSAVDYMDGKITIKEMIEIGSRHPHVGYAITRKIDGQEVFSPVHLVDGEIVLE